MTYIKKIVMSGFKSFATKTEINFHKGINVVIGANGSGKSNISDALCFALGRLSIKSMRASKSKNLIFMGSKNIKPAKEASVEIYFDNSGKSFSLENHEVILKRAVRSNGQSIYKINNETKTRSDVLETLAQAGIDPHGFNIILQGEIHSLVKMHPEERRRIIEEVAGISIYESRKERSLRELEKTESRLKEISTVLRERTSYLRNLENERAHALKFKELESLVRKCKASILDRRKKEKEKELATIRKSIEEKTDQKERMKAKEEEIQSQIERTNEKISRINTHVKESTGVEQEKLNDQIANLKAEIEGLKVRKENYENRKYETERRIEEIQNSMPEYESELNDLRGKSPMMARKQEELGRKKKELSVLDSEIKKLYGIKTFLSSLKEIMKDKSLQLSGNQAESSSVLREIEKISENLNYKNPKSCERAIFDMKSRLLLGKKEIKEIYDSESESRRKISISEEKIQEAEKIKSSVQNIDVCPLCRSKMTEEHKKHVIQDCDEKAGSSLKIISLSRENLKTVDMRKKELSRSIEETERKISEAERELTEHKLVSDRRNYLKKLTESEELLKKETRELDEKRESLEGKITQLPVLEEKYKTKMLEIEEISSRTEKDLDTTLLYKERELEKMRDIVKVSQNNLGEIEENISGLGESIENKLSLLEECEEEEQKVSEKFKKMFSDRDSLQEKIQAQSLELSEVQSEWRQIEEQVNYLKVGNARVDAEKEALEMELKEFSGVEIIKSPADILESRLKKYQESLSKIGSVNLRALEVYDEIKKEYDKISEKADIIEKEKFEILKIIEEIDNKKKKTFMKTFNAINGLFNRNFSKLYTKGKASLEVENKEDIFSGGVNITIKLAKGKYFDATSLSGGEQALVAISLLFAIQEHKPYYFYVFDEIDAPLDKRNSERLSGLLKQYMKSGQYIVVTHNDAIILDSNILYGVSMHEGVSKILSLKMDFAEPTQISENQNQDAREISLK